MRSSISKGTSAGLVTIGLCAVLMQPGLAGAAAASCRSASAQDAGQAAQRPGEYSEQEGEYLRLHREVVAPVLFRDLEAAGLTPSGSERRAESDRFGHRCDSNPGDRTEALVGTTVAKGSRS